MLRIVEWSPVAWTDEIPPFGDTLTQHLREKKTGSGSYAAWKLLYQTLVRNGIEAGEVRFTETGKPYFSDHRVHFSLSHTAGLCAVSVADVPTGIDVERADRIIPDYTLKRALSPEEYLLYRLDPVTAWCKKEAASKISGRGIFQDRAFFTIDPENISFSVSRVSSEGMTYIVVSGYGSAFS